MDAVSTEPSVDNSCIARHVDLDFGCCTEWFASLGYIYMCASIVPFGLVPLAIPIPMFVPYPILVHKS